MENTPLDLLIPKLVYSNGQFIYIDEGTGNVIPDAVMEEYNRHFGLHGYDEYNDETGDCGDE